MKPSVADENPVPALLLQPLENPIGIETKIEVAPYDETTPLQPLENPIGIETGRAAARTEEKFALQPLENPIGIETSGSCCS